MTGVAAFRLENISKNFGPTPALRGVSLDIGPDELLVILGRTGAGKTTLLRVLAGLESQDEGRLLRVGRDISSLSPSDRDIALVFQNFSLYPDWTVRKNLEFPLRAPGRNLGQDEIASRVEEAAALLHIEKFLDRPSHKLSGGEMQRVALGRALVRRPSLFLLDEPLSNLDAKLREELRVELVELRRRLKVPMIFVTHDQQDAFAMADRVAVLHEGRVIQAGGPDDIYHHPLSPEVALQLGQPPINFIKPGLGVRPEDIELSGGPEEALVKLVEDQGPVKVILLEWLGQEIVALEKSSSPLKPGDKVRPRFDPAKAIRWDA